MLTTSLSWLLGILFLIACFGTLMNPPPYVAIATIFLLMGLVLIPPSNRLLKQKFNWKINGGVKTIVVLVGFILICLVVPQVEPQKSPFSIRPLADTKNLD